MWETCKTKKERKEKVKQLLATNDKAVYRAVVAIYRRQTDYEQVCDSTQETNGVGFSAFDAEILSSFAKQLLDGKGLSYKQMEIARKRIAKYSGQLASIAEEREAQIQKQTQIFE